MIIRKRTSSQNSPHNSSFSSNYTSYPPVDYDPDFDDDYLLHRSAHFHDSPQDDFSPHFHETPDDEDLFFTSPEDLEPEHLMFLDDDGEILDDI